MTVNYTTNLSLGQPVTGTESGNWGDDVNYALTAYLDIAIAGGLSISLTSSDITLSNTQGNNTGTGIISTGATGSSAQYAVLNLYGAKTGNRTLTLPTASTGKYYIINNDTTGAYTLTINGVSLVNGEKAIIAWNNYSVSYVKVVNTGGPGSFTTLTASGSAVFTTLTASGSAATPPVVVTFSATAMAINCALSNVFTTTMTANVTVAPTFSNLADGQTINWFITQDATGSRTITWPTSFKWSGGFAGVLSTGANAVDLLVATYRSSTGFWYASLSKAFS